MKRVVLVFALMLVAACGSKDDEDESSRGTGADAKVEREDPATVGAAEATAVAEKIVLQLGDLPSGWRESGKQHTDHNSLPGVLRSCFDEAVRTARPTARATSRSFTDGRAGASVGIAALVPSADAAALAAERLAAAEFGECVRTGFRRVVLSSPGIEVKTVEGAKVGFPPVGEGSVAYRTVLHTTARGTDVRITIDAVFARQGRAITGAIFNAAVLGPDPSLEEAVLRRSVARSAELA